MHVDNHIHLRHIMLYHFEKGWTAAQSCRDLNEVFGEGTISDSVVRRWFSRFKSGDTRTSASLPVESTFYQANGKQSLKWAVNMLQNKHKNLF